MKRFFLIGVICLISLAPACASDDGAQKPAAEHHERAEGEEPGMSGGKSDAHPSHGGDNTSEHHGGHHRFDDAEQWAKRFEDPDRDAWQKPEAVLDRLALDRDTLVADIGSATGYFPVRIAKRVANGRVWGIDIEPDMVRYLNARAAKEGIDNLKSAVGTPSDPKIPEPVDVVLIVNTLHHIEARPAYLQTLKRYLRPGARIAIVDFKKGELPMGPPDKMKLAADEVIGEFVRAGFALDIDERELLPHQYLLIFRLP